MPTYDVVVEVLIVGLLVAAGLAPLLDVVSPDARKIGGFLPIRFGRDLSAAAPIAVALAMVYALGVGTNAVGDKALSSFSLLNFGQSERDDFDRKREAEGKPEMKYKIAEHSLRERGEPIRKWMDDRRSFVRVQRGAVFASIVFIVCWGLHGIGCGFRRRQSAEGETTTPQQPAAGESTTPQLRVKNGKVGHRYGFAYLIAAVISTAFFMYAVKIQEEKYAYHVARLAIGLPPPASPSTSAQSAQEPAAQGPDRTAPAQ